LRKSLYDLCMAILIRKHGERWERAEEVIYADEAQLQKMLYDSPELIPTKLENQVAVFTKESGLPGSGFTDLLVVPKRHGQLNQPQETQPAKRSLTFEEVLENCPNDHSRTLLAVLGRLWDAAKNYVKPGTVGASFQAQIGTKSQPIFWAYPNSGLHCAFGELSKRGAPADALESYRNSVSKLPGFISEEILRRSEPITTFSRTTEAAMSTFVEHSRAFVDAWRRSTTS
jgi:hypothetical protein